MKHIFSLIQILLYPKKKTNNTFLNLVLLFTFVIFTLSYSHLMAWPTINGVAICSAANDQEYPAIASDGSGGAIITWEDFRNDNTGLDAYGNIYAQRIDSSGSTLWTFNGVAICTATGDQLYPTIVSDGSGGAIITWSDGNIYAQRVNSTGSTLWTLNGVAICTAANYQYYPQIVSDRAGGAVITWWADIGIGNPVIYAQRVNSNGSTLWTNNGVLIEVGGGSPVIVSDGSGGAIITWSNGNPYAQRVNSNGSTLWILNGVAMSTAANNQNSPAITSDGSGGAIITWNGDGIYAQRVNSMGSTLWTTNGVTIYNVEDGNPAIVNDGSGGAIITWGNSNVYAQRLNSAGSILWTPAGVTICTIANGPSNIQIVSDGSGGGIITWKDYRSNPNPNGDIYAQRVNSTGNTIWTTNGIPICTSAVQQFATIVSDGLGGAIFAWTDIREGVGIAYTGYDIYAQSVDSNGFITPPISFAYLPSLKLFTFQSIYHAFNIEDFNTGDTATTYSILSNFLFLSSLDSSSVNQAAYGSPTTGTNIYLADNAYGEGTATNEVKYSTYKIYKLPKVGLTIGSSWVVNVASYTYSSTGLAIPPSFGNPDAITVSDTTLVSATWLGNTAIQLISLQAFSSPVDVDVTASPNATSPYGSDVDVEDIQVYTNLLTNSTFSTSNDTSIWMPFELAPGRTELATQSWISTYTDSAGTQANGVWKFSFADGNSGVKSTPMVSTWISTSTGQWYIVRMRLVADTPNNAHQSVLFGFNNYLGQGIQTDIAANVLFGIPTVWTWQETPMLVHSSTTTGYPQFQFKASTTGNIYVDEIQIINSAPTLVDANRNNTRLFYAYGNFDDPNETTGWGQEVYYGAGSIPEISVSNNELVLDFSNASSGSGQQGIKWTANNGVEGVGAATFPVTVNREVGVRATVAIQSGTFDSNGIILLAAYGVQTSGQQNIAIAPSNLMASAGVGTLVSGTYRTVADAVSPYYQFQFGVRSDVQGILAVTNVDLDTDQDDPNFGDPTLFP
jgi:hypothetical protein